jgi:Peptidase A4 family
MGRPVRAAAALAAALALALIGAAAASADSSDSSNWAGYAAHRSGVRFRKVIGAWTQPHVSCTGGRDTYSSVWVGLGGYSISSPALEQIGTELDCTAAGRAVSSAWYELVPAASHTTKLIVRPGDRVQANVVVTGNQVKLAITNLTRHRSFTTTLHDTVLDTTSAEWIVEAPSACASSTDCQTLPLADFGSAAITGAHATTTSGHIGAITDSRWSSTKITLAGSGNRFVAGGLQDAQPVFAAPSPLTAGGTGFTVSYLATTVAARSAALAAAAPTVGRRLVHPGR